MASPSHTDDPYVDILEGSFIRVKNTTESCGFAKPDHFPQRIDPAPSLDPFHQRTDPATFFEDIFLDSSSHTFASLCPPGPLIHDCNELLVFHIYKQWWDDRLVYALLLEKARDPDSFKRAGCAASLL
jgi:hypothetical protein